MGCAEGSWEGRRRRGVGGGGTKGRGSGGTRGGEGVEMGKGYGGSLIFLFFAIAYKSNR